MLVGPDKPDKALQHFGAFDDGSQQRSAGVPVRICQLCGRMGLQNEGFAW